MLSSNDFLRVGAVMDLNTSRRVIHMYGESSAAVRRFEAGITLS